MLLIAGAQPRRSKGPAWLDDELESDKGGKATFSAMDFEAERQRMRDERLKQVSCWSVWGL